MKCFTLSVAAAVAVLCAGFSACNKSASNAPAPTEVAKSGHSHNGWWCNEHGMPEEVCAQCSTDLVPDFKAKGDWCDEHNRPDSQCFICHPEKEAEFAALYEAKYGKQPPKPTAEEGADHAEHDHEHKT